MPPKSPKTGSKVTKLVFLDNKGTHIVNEAYALKHMISNALDLEIT